MRIPVFFLTLPKLISVDEDLQILAGGLSHCQRIRNRLRHLPAQRLRQKQAQQSGRDPADTEDCHRQPLGRVGEVADLRREDGANSGAHWREADTLSPQGSGVQLGRVEVDGSEGTSGPELPKEEEGQAECGNWGRGVWDDDTDSAQD